MPTSLAHLLDDVLGTDLPIRVRAYDGTDIGPPDAPATLTISSPDALRRLVGAPGELGLARAFVAGDLEVDGDIFAVLALHDRLQGTHLGAAHLAALARHLGADALHRLHPPPE